MLQLTNYKKYYGGLLVLDIPSLKLEKGIYWIKGKNGSGKTTLLKSTAGLIPFDGDINVNNTNIRTQRRSYLRQVNYAEAEPLYPTFLTGKDLIDFYFETKGGTKQNIDDLIKSFGVNSYLQNKIGTYSSGMTKKLSLVLAFIGTPTLVLLDEPFITLDTEAVYVLQELIKHMNNSGVSFCISSHQELDLFYPFTTLLIQNQKTELV